LVCVIQIKDDDLATMNAPERSAAFILDDDEQKIEYTVDTKATNAGTFRFNKEDYTLANLLRMQLLRDPNVRFAGYIHPHPLLHFFNLKIQTNTSTTDPKTSLSNALEDLSGEVDHLITQVNEALQKWNREHGESMY
jgi:DNA-directed RNA polymerase II subunit RPB11